MPAVLFVLYVIVEIAALVGVGHLIGVIPTILLLIAGSAAGMLMIGAQGRRVFEQFRRAGRGEIAPGTAVAEGALVATGGVLMFVPGLVTSLFGLLLLLPPTRFLIRPLVTAFAARRFGSIVDAVPYHGVIIDGDDVVDGVVVNEWYDDGRTNTRPAIGHN
ncbi:FxsA family protein [Nocardia australiensis]|uniref:FxsA family protein n=1 Tax=Nocardia australiensis TaxID=2887191 RepID=UPI001D1375E1|nr:FxsA family protein [Nocardia australiensis]